MSQALLEEPQIHKTLQPRPYARKELPRDYWFDGSTESPESDNPGRFQDAPERRGIEFLPNGSFHAGVTKRYRVDGEDDYTIEFREQSDGTYRIYAPVCPSDPYGNSSRVHHRYESGEICIAEGKEPHTLDRAVAIAWVWMKGYSQYIRSGVFPKKGARVDV